MSLYSPDLQEKGIILGAFWRFMGYQKKLFWRKEVFLLCYLFTLSFRFQVLIIGVNRHFGNKWVMKSPSIQASNIVH